MEKYLEAIRESGYKLTSARFAVIEVLVKRSKPITVRKIHQLLNNRNINLSSVYRNLCLFKKIGIVFEEEFEKESYYYISDKHHHHIYCESCGYIECIPCNYNKHKSPMFSFINHSIVLKGKCNNCEISK